MGAIYQKLMGKRVKVLENYGVILAYKNALGTNAIDS
jgi:hypothetical protein